MRSLTIAATAAVCVLAGASPRAAHAGPFQLGTTYTVTGSDLPAGSLPETVTLNGLPKTINGGPLTVSENFIPAAGGMTWLQVNFFTSDGSPIAVDPNGHWNATFQNILFAQPLEGAGFLFWFDKDGTPAAQTAELVSGFPVIPNPIPGESGVVSGVLFSPTPPPGTFTDGGVDLPFFGPEVTAAGIPVDVNGFHIAELFVPASTAVPEPSSLTLLGLAAGAGVLFRKCLGVAAP